MLGVAIKRPHTPFRLRVQAPPRLGGNYHNYEAFIGIHHTYTRFGIDGYGM